MTEYHCADSCNKCAGENEVDSIDSLDGRVSEAKTRCKECGHTDYWAYGFFESGQDMASNCKKYSFDEPRLFD